jgi:hypothetical protein
MKVEGCERSLEPEFNRHNREDEEERREERRLKALDNAWKAAQERWERENQIIISVKPPAGERLQLEFDFWKTA